MQPHNPSGSKPCINLSYQQTASMAQLIEQATFHGLLPRKVRRVSVFNTVPWVDLRTRKDLVKRHTSGSDETFAGAGGQR